MIYTKEFLMECVERKISRIEAEMAKIHIRVESETTKITDLGRLEEIKNNIGYLRSLKAGVKRMKPLDYDMYVTLFQAVDERDDK